MTLTNRLWHSFHQEFGRPGTQVYVLGMVVFLSLGGLVYEGILSQKWIVLSPSLFFAMPVADGRKTNWKRLGFSFVTYLLLPPVLLFVYSAVAPWHAHPDFAMALYVTVLLGAVAFLSIATKRLFPVSDDTFYEDEKVGA